MGNQTQYPLPIKFSKIENGILNQYPITHRQHRKSNIKKTAVFPFAVIRMGNGSHRPNVAGLAWPATAGRCIAAAARRAAASQPTAGLFQRSRRRCECRSTANISQSDVNIKYAVEIRGAALKSAV